MKLKINTEYVYLGKESARLFVLKMNKYGKTQYTSSYGWIGTMIVYIDSSHTFINNRIDGFEYLGEL